MSKLPSLRCQAHWQNAKRNRFNQILPKSFPAHPALTHGINDIAANLKLRYIKRQNNGLKANTHLKKLGGHCKLTMTTKFKLFSGLTHFAVKRPAFPSANR